MSDTCHELLLRLAGRLPDDLLWRFRDWAATDAVVVLARVLPLDEAGEWAARRAVEITDRHCQGPGCHVSAERCDIDHRIPHPVGPTSPDNLEPRCRTDHRVKTLTDTQVEADEYGGVWITLPSGRRYYRPAEQVLERRGRDRPDDRVVLDFLAAKEGLSLINGTQFMAAMASLLLVRARGGPRIRAPVRGPRLARARRRAHRRWRASPSRQRAACIPARVESESTATPERMR